MFPKNVFWMGWMLRSLTSSSLEVLVLVQLYVDDLWKASGALLVGL